MVCRVLFVVIGLSTLSWADRVPSTDDIEDYNDPILRDVFGSKKAVPQLPQEIPQQQVQAARQRGIGQQRRIPAQQTTEYQPNRHGGQGVYQQPYQPPPPHLSSYSSPQQPYYSSQQSSPFAQLAVNGAQGFLTGAQAVGQAFGFSPSSYSAYNSGYEVPNSGGFFG